MCKATESNLSKVSIATSLNDKSLNKLNLPKAKTYSTYNSMN